MTNVQTIVANAHTIAASVVPTWKVLRFGVDLSRNDGRDAAKAYRCLPGEAQPADVTGLFGTETLQHHFDFVLSDDIARYNSDDDLQNVLNALYDYADQIFKKFVNQRMNLATVVQVGERTIAAPELQKNQIVYLRFRFPVTYRQAL
jgi:hypothetical protein